MNANKPTKVIFRKWNGGDVIALFPQVPYDRNGIYCMSYEHIGQHGSAGYDTVVCQSSLASPEEYADLKHELESRPFNYVLSVASRESSKDRQIRRSAASA